MHRHMRWMLAALFPPSAEVLRWFEAPIDVLLVGHRFVHQRVKIWVVCLQRLASRNRSVGTLGRLALACGVEVCLYACRPILGGAARRHGTFPKTLGGDFLTELLQLVVEF